MTIDWVYEGSNAGFVVAHDQGFYRDAGFDVTIERRQGLWQYRTTGRRQGDAGRLCRRLCGQQRHRKGMNIKTIGSIYRRAPSAIIVLDASPIKTPKDLEGRTLAMTAGSGLFQQWPAYVKGANLDVSKIKIVNIDPSGLGPALISGKVDAIGGYAASFVPSSKFLAKNKRACCGSPMSASMSSPTASSRTTI